MKTNSSYFYILAMLFTGMSFSYAQDIFDPLSNAAFDKNIMQDINFMVLGDNNPKQGFSYEYGEKKTELSLSGVLSNPNRFLITIDGSFSVDDGAYIFDKDGSKKGKLSLNFFRPIWCNYKSYPAAKDAKNSNSSNKANRARQMNHIAEKELSQKLMDNFMALDAIMKTFKFPDYATDDLINNGLLKENKVIVRAADETARYTALLKYYKNTDKGTVPDKYQSLVDKINSGTKKPASIKGMSKDEAAKYKTKADESSFNYERPSELDIEKLFKDYDESVKRLENIDEEVNDYQIKTFKDIWIYEFNNYLGASPYYEREGLDIYDGSKTIFSDRFVDTKGDLYGVNFNLNQVWRYKSGIFFFIRELVSFGRGSNFKDFKKKDYVYSTLPEPIETGSVVEEQKKTGYYEKNGLPYQYGFEQKYGLELFFSYKVVGLYGRFGYTKNEALYKKDALPLETGFLINVKSEKKNVVSILLFVAREDLNVHPDLDTNFGFKIGLPINIRKSEKDKEKEEEKS